MEARNERDWNSHKVEDIKIGNPKLLALLTAEKASMTSFSLQTALFPSRYIKRTVLILVIHCNFILNHPNERIAPACQANSSIRELLHLAYGKLRGRPGALRQLVQLQGQAVHHQFLQDDTIRYTISLYSGQKGTKLNNYISSNMFFSQSMDQFFNVIKHSYLPAIISMLSCKNLQFSEYPREDRLMRAAVTEMMQSNSLKLEGGGFTYYKLDKVFECEKEVRVETVNLRRNYEPAILHKLLHLSFENLIKLTISHNRVSSLQPIIYLQAPHLNDLDISYNRITSLRSLRKSPFSLCALYIQGNSIIELKHLEEICFQNHVKEIYLQETRIIPYDIQSLVSTQKIAAFKIASITMKKRINHSAVTDSLRTRNANIKIIEPRIA